MPLQIDIPWLQLYIFFISLVGFVFYLIFTIYKKNQNIIEGMLGNWSKYHFIPLLLLLLYILYLKVAETMIIMDLKMD